MRHEYKIPLMLAACGCFIGPGAAGRSPGEATVPIETAVSVAPTAPVTDEATVPIETAVSVAATAPVAAAVPFESGADAEGRGLAPRVDEVVTEWLAATHAPSASIAIVRHGTLVYARAYGHAQLEPPVAAVPESRYAIDSVTKEFTAAAVLLLAEQGKLALDEPVSRWFPDVGDARRVTLRQLLNHTSGIRDYWPQDFVTPEMHHGTTAAALIEEWVRRPLDFVPGTEWQYSNTGFVLAAAIVERAAAEPFFEFLQRQIFSPLKMTHVLEDGMPRAAVDAVGYTRYGLGRVRRAPKEAVGWLFGAANLVMQPADLARWDASLLDRSLLRASSYAAEFAPAILKNKTSVPYALGLDVEHIDGRLRIGHAGGGSGFLADNRLWPDERDAIVVLTNNDWASPAELTRRIAFLVLTPSPAEARLRTVFRALQNGAMDRSLFTTIGNSYFTAAVLADLHASLTPLGALRDLRLDGESQRGGMLTRRWQLVCRNGRLDITERGRAQGALDEFLITPSQD
jgi:CubicO group peptidase (beta-lactamase class C family)